MSAPRRVVDRSYLLGAALGEGGMGAVYRATHLLNHQVVALKLVTQTQAQQAHGGGNGHGADQPSAEVELRMALAREFQTLASLHHPNVIRVQSYGFDEDLGSYFTMEILNNCRTIVDAGGGRSLADNVSLLAQLLRALSYIHRRGVIHRDLKPSAVTPEGTRVGAVPPRPRIPHAPSRRTAERDRPRRAAARHDALRTPRRFALASTA